MIVITIIAVIAAFVYIARKGKIIGGLNNETKQILENERRRRRDEERNN